MNKKYPKYITELQDYLIGIGNYSKNYVENIVTTSLQFLDYINESKYNNIYESLEDITLNEIRTITNSDIYGFIYHLVEKGFKESTRILKLEHLKKLFDYLFRIKNTLFKEPLKDIKREKKKGRTLPNYLSLEEARKLTNVYKDSTSEYDIRDTAMIKLFLTSGIRLSELKNLKIKNINFKENIFTVVGKGNKERTCYMNSNTKVALLKYIEIRNKKQIEGKNIQYLFLTDDSKIHTISSIKRIIKKAYKKAGINPQNYSVHTLRHTCATLLIRNNVDIKIIQELLGHSRIETTQIYTHIYNKAIEDEMLKHPLAKFKIKDALSFAV